METINNVANAAAKAVWGSGDANKEPVSGVTGDVATGQPYDAGNLDPEDQKKIENDLATPADESAGGNINNANNKDGSGLATGASATTTSTSKTEASLSHRDDSHKQSDTRHPDEASAGADPDNASTTVDLKGPGPRPLEAVAREHGGDAGCSGQLVETKPSDVTSNSNNSNSSAGTSEEYVKTTGFVADGGDFDATNPGAGKEADRLVEEKGHAVGASSDATASSPTEKKHGRNKPSLGERIKAKFHKH